MADGQEQCYACGQHHRARGYRAEHHVNPVVIIAVCLAVVGVLTVLWINRTNSARKQAALLAEEEAVRVQDSTRRADRQWLDAVRTAGKDEEALAFSAALDDIEGRFQSVRMRVAEFPTVQQESIVNQFGDKLAVLRNWVIILASSAETDKPAWRDSLDAGKRRAEDLMQELGSTE